MAKNSMFHFNYSSHSVNMCSFSSSFLPLRNRQRKRNNYFKKNRCIMRCFCIKLNIEVILKYILAQMKAFMLINIFAKMYILEFM